MSIVSKKEKKAMTPAEEGIAEARRQAKAEERKPYVVKFMHVHDDAKSHEEMFLCLNAQDRIDAAEKFWSITGGEGKHNYLISVTGDEGIEAWWLPQEWKFVTIPPREEKPPRFFGDVLASFEEN